MKKKLLAALIFVGMAGVGWSDEQSVSINLPGSKSDVFFQEPFTVQIHVANSGKINLTLFGSQFCEFKDQWTIDNPFVEFKRFPKGITCPSFPRHDIAWLSAYQWKYAGSPIISLEPGKSNTDAIDLIIPRNDRAPSSIIFRLGFKDKTKILWSNPINLSLKKEEIFPVKIMASTKVSKVKMQDSITVSVQIKNTTNSSQDIGTENCGVHGVAGWTADLNSVEVSGGSAGCLGNAYRPNRIILKPDEVYEQICTVSFNKNLIKPGPLTFQLGFELASHSPVWSNPLAVDILAE